jgi:hypothetical protein
MRGDLLWWKELNQACVNSKTMDTNLMSHFLIIIVRSSIKISRGILSNRRKSFLTV